METASPTNLRPGSGGGGGGGGEVGAGEVVGEMMFMPLDMDAVIRKKRISPSLFWTGSTRV